MHPIGDFLTPNRKWGIKSWKELSAIFLCFHYKIEDGKLAEIYTRNWIKFLTSEWVLVLNPLHFIWDKWSPLRRHHLYLEEVLMTPVDGIMAIRPLFWRWLALDQLYHMISNIFLAWILGVYL